MATDSHSVFHSRTISSHFSLVQFGFGYDNCTPCGRRSSATRRSLSQGYSATLAVSSTQEAISAAGSYSTKISRSLECFLSTAQTPKSRNHASSSGPMQDSVSSLLPLCSNVQINDSSRGTSSPARAPSSNVSPVHGKDRLESERLRSAVNDDRSIISLSDIAEKAAHSSASSSEGGEGKSG